jgi:hypothetical protein
VIVAALVNGNDIVGVIDSVALHHRSRICASITGTGTGTGMRTLGRRRKPDTG